MKLGASDEAVNRRFDSHCASTMHRAEQPMFLMCATRARWCG